jgi:amino acid adenylation domain-containing protein
MNEVSDKDPHAAENGDVYAFPTSPAQQRLWFLDQLEPNTAVYSIPQAIRLRGKLAPELLERALGEIVSRHEALRTTFAAPEGEPLQIVREHHEFRLRQVSLEGMPEGNRLTEARSVVQTEAERPFDLAEGPLVRAGLLRLSEEDHVFWLNVHHIVCDGWSLALLYEELSTLYRAFGEGAASPLTEVPIQYADYAAWQRELWQGPTAEEELAHWRGVLGTNTPTLALPIDGQRPATLGVRGDQISFIVPRTLSDKIVALGRSEGASLFQTLLSAFYVLLYRLSGQSDVLVGSPVAHRERAEIERAIGFYTNTVVFRGDLSGNPTFRHLLDRTKKAVLAGLAHQELPFEKVVEAAQTVRTSGFGPLFQTMFALQRAPESALTLPGIDVELWPIHPRTSKFELLLEMQEVPDGLRGYMEYNTDLFERATAEGFARCFLVILESITSAPDSRIDAVPVLSQADLHFQLVSWNATDAVLPSKCMPALFADRARETPEAVAVIFEDAQLSYGELDRKSNQLARLLAQRGTGPGTRVGLFLDRTPQVLVALLAVSKVGAAYVPLDPAYPSDRVAYMLADSNATMVLSTSSEAERLPPSVDGSWRLVLLDQEADTIALLPSDSLGAGPSPDSIAYVLYTSGSTGRPKGVVIAHRSLTNFLLSMQREPGVSTLDRVLAVTTISFDISALELYLPLVTGATVVLASREVATDGDLLLRLISEAQVSIIQATPATYRLLLDAGWKGRSQMKALCGGEALPSALASDLLERVSELWNMYGPTETTVWSTLHRITSSEQILIGRPIANTTVYVLDSKMQPVPVGVPGDLYIGGAGLAVGYWGRPDQTDERFVANPFGRTEDRLYRTGDLARYRQGGMLQYLGRIDDQVKIRGFRIELGEIESALTQHVSIEQAVAAVREDRSGDKRIVAYCVYQNGSSATATELRTFLREALPDYMVPHLFVGVQTLPLTSNGKIDRKALPDPFGQTVAANAAVMDPRSDTERIVAEVWSDVLRVPRVGLYDNFFEIGGHSLISMQAISRIEKRTGYRINPRSMAFQTLEQIAAEIDAAQPHGMRSSANDALPSSVKLPSAESASQPSLPPTVPVPTDPPRPRARSLSQRILEVVKERLPGG